MTPSVRVATAIGGIAILLWASLALVTSLSRSIPTFEALAITFAIGAVTLAIGFYITSGPAAMRAGFRAWPAKAWALAIAGIFVYHALYFLAFRLAPVGPVAILNYLWPLLIVIFAGLLPGGTSTLGWPQWLGGLIGFAATILLVGGDGIEWGGAAMLGYLAALSCAVVWGLYSVLNNRVGAKGSEPMVGVLAAVALLGALGHVVTGEPFVMPDAGTGIALLISGIGPVGAAFAAWDHATKKGDVGLLGVLSYATPPLSMILLVAGGQAEPTWRLAAGTGLVVGGALLAAIPAKRRRPASVA